MSATGWVSVGLAAMAAALAVPPRVRASLTDQPHLVGATSHTGAPGSTGQARRGGAMTGVDTGERGVPGAAETNTTRRRILVAIFMGLCVWLLVPGAVGALLAAVTSAATWHLVGRMQPPAERRRREQLLRALPHVVDLMAATLSVGASPSAAVERVAAVLAPPMGEELRSVTARLRLGADPVDVWGELGEHPELGPLGRCLVRAADSGASVAEAMCRLADDLRRSARADMEARARSVGVKATAPLGMCLLPAFVLVGVVPLVAGSVSHLLTR